MKISIITVVYNARASVERTICAVAKQTYTNKEFIVIDGGSTDGTLDILKKHKDKIDILVSEPDNGIYDAMNKGVANATGDYLIFINADDYFYDEHVLSKVADCPRADFIFGDQYDEKDGQRTLAQNLDALDVYHMFRGYFAHQAILAKRELFEKYGNFDVSYKICADWDWILRCLVNGATTYRLNSPLVVFSLGGASGVAGEKGLLSRERARLIKKNLGGLHVENTLLRFEKIFRPFLKRTGMSRRISTVLNSRLSKKFIASPVAERKQDDA